VYGQVVADDMFGDVYMIPLQGIMDDIKTLLDAAVVRLPASSKELRQILMTQLHREHMNPDCEESSKDSHAPITNGTALPNNYGSTSTVIPESAFVNTSTNSQSHAEPLDADHVHKSRSHVCAICARSFKRLGHFKRHERTHTQEKNSFECPQCQEFFERKDLLIRHQRKHNHSEIDSKDKDVPTTNGKARQEVGDYSFIPRKAYSTYFESFRSSGDSETESLGICSPQPLSDGEFYEESEISANSDKAPKAKKSRTEAPWTSKEDQCLKQMRSDGASWDRITEKFWDRPKGSVKRHWYKDLNREGMAEAASAPASVPEQGK
jgi:DNA-directed RNA polymerase subunit RPC12/RpoP